MSFNDDVDSVSDSCTSDGDIEHVDLVE